MSDQQLRSLIKWLDTFEINAPHLTPEDISNGVALSEALAQIAPEWFNSAWRSKIKMDVGSNWRLKVSNLKKIIEAVMEYYVECLNQQLHGFTKPDAIKIGEHCDKEELRRLLQLILGCAVNCNQKQHYITQIMGMEELVQQVIMQSIQELESGMHGPKLSLGSSLNFEPFDVADGSQQRLLNDLQSAVDSRDHLAQRCHELDQQLSLLQEERNTLLLESKKLLARLDEFENPEESGNSLRYSGLRKQVDALKTEMFKLETSRDDYRLKLELLEKENLELQMKQADLQKAADEAIHLKDEVDALRETADKVAKYELTIESYKKKMEDFIDLKRQVKILEDKNMEYIQNKIEYEEEVKKANLLRNHLELCKQQLTETHHKLDEQTNKCDKLEFDSKKLEAQLNALQRERDRLIIERDTLKETNDELKCTQQRTVDSVADLSTDEAVVNTENISPEIKEKLVLLQHENKMLKLNQQKGGDDKSNMIQGLLEDYEERLNNIRAQNRKANQRILELENKLEENLGNHSTTENKNEQKIMQMEQELKKIKSDCDKLNSLLDERENLLQVQKQNNSTLQQNLTRKESEYAALEDRYKKYVDKAKSVIKSLDPKQGNSSPSEIAMLRSQNLEKRKTIEEMERTCEKMKMMKEMEEKLLISAFYNYGISRHQEAVDQRLNALNSSQAQSFLARQRQPAARKLYTTYNSK